MRVWIKGESRALADQYALWVILVLKIKCVLLCCVVNAASGGWQTTCWLQVYLSSTQPVLPQVHPHECVCVCVQKVFLVVNTAGASGIIRCAQVWLNGECAGWTHFQAFFSKPPTCFLDEEGCSRPKQAAPTTRYLYKVHWWIYTLLLTTDISNNLCQMPSLILDFTPALSPHPPFSLTTADVSFPPSPPLSVCWPISERWCEGWSAPFVSSSNSSLCLQTVYRETWRSLLPPQAGGEREGTLNPPSPLLPLYLLA